MLWISSLNSSKPEINFPQLNHKVLSTFFVVYLLKKSVLNYVFGSIAAGFLQVTRHKTLNSWIGFGVIIIFKITNRVYKIAFN